jgi:phospholipase C
MSHTDYHLLIRHKGRTSIRTSNGQSTASFGFSGSMAVGFPGKLKVDVLAGYVLKVRLAGEDGRPARWQRQPQTIPLQVEIRTPDGNMFTADHITLNDILRFRDLRGVSHGTWTFKVSGQGPSVLTKEDEGEDDTELEAGNAYVTIAIEETVTSKSANPLVNLNVGANQGRRFGFDLWRVGIFTATAQAAVVPTRGRRRLKLRDPDGNVVAESGTSRLAYPVTLRTLDKSRDPAGNVRPWSLEVARPTDPSGQVEVSVWATVIETAHIGTGPLMERINYLIGEGGSKLNIYGEMTSDDMMARLEILDPVSASLIERYKLLKRVLKQENQDPDVDIADLTVGTKYNLFKKARGFGGGFKVWLYGIKVRAIHIEIGESVQIQPPVPALKINVEVTGSAKIEYKGIGLANAAIRNNRIKLEAGLRLDPDGTFSLVSWIEKDPLDVDVANDALILAIAAGLVLGPEIIVTPFAVAEYIEEQINDSITGGFQAVLDSAGSQLPHIIAMFLGDDFTYRLLRFKDEDILFEYIAPLEPEPKPSPIYLGIIGRSATQIGPQAWMIRPPTLGNTWAAENLTSKIDHIVLVMMENRSFDHVLGYIAKSPGTASDGLTDELTNFLRDQGHFVRKLKSSNIELNGVGLRTKFPVHVGHFFDDVTEQLSEKIVMPSGRSINNPSGFKRNFTDRVRDPLVVDDVLGYYEADDLAFFKFLTDNYAWCEQFYSSHPGPTLPNRFLSLTGNVQYDRTGEAILDNNKGENFVLSRAMSIFDLLTRKGIGWRIYESFPSVATLRMFARYATDNDNIVNISRLEQDIANGGLPAVTFIEPAMHHDPQNDDHPIADMYRGQRFLKWVYDVLRSSEALWSRTLLIITYDEHGGFYDHVIPPIAEVLTRPIEMGGGTGGTGHFTPDTLIIRYGVRVPTFVVSPWVPAGKGADIVFDFCSILKTILARFCGQDKPFLSDRVHLSRSFEAYLTEATPRLEVEAPPPLPPLSADELIRRGIITEPLSSRQMRAGSVDFHDLTGMLARMLGRDSPQPK